MWPMARLHAGSVAHGAAAGSARAEVGASRLLLPARVNRHHGSPGAASRACAQPYALGACTQLRGFAAAPVAQVRADDDEAAARGFIAGGHSLADFPPERIRNFSIIAHVDHGAFMRLLLLVQNQDRVRHFLFSFVRLVDGHTLVTEARKPRHRSMRRRCGNCSVLGIKAMTTCSTISCKTVMPEQIMH